MSSVPPPKEGEVLTSSTKLRLLMGRLEKAEKELAEIRYEIHEILEASGY